MAIEGDVVGPVYEVRLRPGEYSALNTQTFKPECPGEEDLDGSLSNAALRSRRIRVLRAPAPAEVRRSSTTLRSAVSVLWRGWKPN